MRLLCFLPWLFVITPLRAEWRVESSRKIPLASPAVSLWSKTARNGGELELYLLKLDPKRADLRVIDLPAGATVAGALRAAGAVAGVNGGYFHPDRKPLGLVISGGAQLHPLERSKLLSGLLAVTPKRAALLRRAEYKGGPSVKEALQAGPFLVDGGRKVAGLNATRAAERTVILADKTGVIALLTTQAITLADLGELLATPGIFPEVSIQRALNLDGGSSTALWADAAPAPFSRPEWKKVRNVLAVMPKAAKR